MAFNYFQAALDAVDTLINYMEEKNFLNKPGLFIFFISMINNNFKKKLTDTGVNVQKRTRVFSTRRWVILVARTRRKKRRK